MIKTCPDMLQREMAMQFGVARSSIQDALKKLGIKRKKTLLYKERSEKKRKEYLEKIADIPGDSIVYVDAELTNICTESIGAIRKHGGKHVKL
jgi:hypothetical protein